MRFPTVAIAFTLGAPLAMGFAPSSSSAFVAKSTGAAVQLKNIGVSQAPHADGCFCNACIRATHAAGCGCGSCSGLSALWMSTEEVAEAAADVPVEVAAMDGVDSEEEAHNAERPARGSGIHKHKKGGKAGIPLSELEVGSTVEGTVKGTTSYGAFLDIGSQTDALLHVSRMSDDFVANVEDVVKKGDVVSVRIVSVDLEKKQVAVTMRSEEAENRPARSEGGSRRKDRPRRSTGDREAQRATLDALAAAGYDSDKFIEGEVVSQLDFGAFVRFDASQLDETVSGELDGLVHISALSVGRTENVSDVVSIGDKVQVRVKNVDAQGGKVSLSMIAAADEPAPRAPRADSADKPKRRARSMFTEAEMGASDWKESVETILGDQPSFANMPIIVDKRN